MPSMGMCPGAWVPEQEADISSLGMGHCKQVTALSPLGREGPIPELDQGMTGRGGQEGARAFQTEGTECVKALRGGRNLGAQEEKGSENRVGLDRCAVASAHRASVES